MDKTDAMAIKAATEPPCETFSPKSPAFEIGSAPRAMIVLKVVARASQIRKWRYLVKAAVCGHKIILSHKTLLDTRESAYPGLCQGCMRRQKKQELLAERASAAEKDTDKPPPPPDLSIKLPSKYMTEKARDHEKQLTNQWVHALWGKPGDAVLRPHIPALGLINLIEF